MFWSYFNTKLEKRMTKLYQTFCYKVLSFFAVNKNVQLYRWKQVCKTLQAELLTLQMILVIFGIININASSAFRLWVSHVCQCFWIWNCIIEEKKKGKKKHSNWNCVLQETRLCLELRLSAVMTTTCCSWEVTVWNRTIFDCYLENASEQSLL